MSTLYGKSAYRVLDKSSEETKQGDVSESDMWGQKRLLARVSLNSVTFTGLREGASQAKVW